MARFETAAVLREHKRRREACKLHNLKKEIVEGKFLGNYVCDECKCRFNRETHQAYMEGLNHGLNSKAM